MAKSLRQMQNPCLGRGGVCFAICFESDCGDLARPRLECVGEVRPETQGPKYLDSSQIAVVQLDLALEAWFQLAG